MKEQGNRNEEQVQGIKLAETGSSLEEGCPTGGVSFCQILNTVEDTRNFAAQFARTLHAPVVIALHGDLGMGKSEIARSIIKTLCGADTVVPSPTFTIVQNYDGISHFDLYRVNDTSELVEIGLPHSIENDITLIEWPEIAAGILPKNTIHIYLENHGMGRKLIIK